MIQKEEDAAQPSPEKPEVVKPTRTRKPKIINPEVVPAEIIEPENDTVITEIIEETITISAESNDDTAAEPSKKDTKSR